MLVLDVGGYGGDGSTTARVFQELGQAWRTVRPACHGSIASITWDHYRCPMLQLQRPPHKWNYGRANGSIPRAYTHLFDQMRERSRPSRPQRSSAAICGFSCHNKVTATAHGVLHTDIIEHPYYHMNRSTCWQLVLLEKLHAYSTTPGRQSCGPVTTPLTRPLTSHPRGNPCR